MADHDRLDETRLAIDVAGKLLIFDCCANGIDIMPDGTLGDRLIGRRNDASFEQPQVLRSTVLGEKAFGSVGGPTLFAEALLQALGGLAASRSDDWAIDTAALEAGRRELSLPRVFLLEAEYELAMRRAEADFVRSVVAELRDGTFADLDLWRRVAAGEVLPEFATPVTSTISEEP